MVDGASSPTFLVHSLIELIIRLSETVDYLTCYRVQTREIPDMVVQITSTRHLGDDQAQQAVNYGYLHQKTSHLCPL